MPEVLKEESICDPSFSEWNSTFAINKSLNRPLRLHTKVIEAAKSFEDKIWQIAKSVGIDPSPAKIFESKEIAMTGHQPMVYHMGILEKNKLLSKFADEQRVVGINVIIDTDTEDCGFVNIPNISNQSITKFSIGNGPLLITNQVLKDVSGFPEGKAKEAYRNLTGKPILIANTIVRSLYEVNRHYLNVPLSDLVSFPESQEFFKKIIADSARFFEIYNSTLKEHRQARNIKNSANPFPDLKMDGTKQELPFWVVNLNSGTRNPYYSSYVLQNSEILVPKNALVTLFLRLCCSDFFIHGLGGAHYDHFTDALIKNYFGLVAPHWVTASATRLLFGEERKKYEESVFWNEKRLSIHSHLDEYLGKGVVTATSETALKLLNEKRSPLLEKLKTGKSAGIDVKEVAIELKALDQKMKEIVVSDSAFKEKLQGLTVPQETLALWYFREYPYFLFSNWDFPHERSA